MDGPVAQTHPTAERLPPNIAAPLPPIVAERLPPHNLRECPHCGLFQRIGRLRPNQVAECERCGAHLRRRRRNSLGVTLALATTGLALMLVALPFPLLSFRFVGVTEMTSLTHLPVAFESQRMPLLGLAVLLTTIAAPLLRLVLTALVLGGLRGWFSRTTLVTMARLRAVLAPWAMIEVFMLGLFVAYTRLAAKSVVIVGPALFAMGALMLVVACADAWLDEDALWTAISRRPRAPGAASPLSVRPGAGPIGCDSCGQVSHLHEGDACPRCDTPLRHRRPAAVTRTWALLAAAALLYIPANTLPILTLVQIGWDYPSTIMGGVFDLLEVRMWPLALLVFVASILVPILKLAGLAILLTMTQWGSTTWLRDRTRLFRLVDFVGRWSMIDIFMLAVLTALVRMGIFASVYPEWGAVAFSAVVVLTMLAALSFDPREMWDAADRRAAAQPDAAAPPRKALA